LASTFNTFEPFSFLVFDGISTREEEMFDWMLYVNVALVMAIVVGLYFSRSPEALIMIVAIASLLIYATGRYWRNPEGFSTRR
jgi:undecaprenyl pyrophosphate phosphatase UppP